MRQGRPVLRTGVSDISSIVIAVSLLLTRARHAGRGHGAAPVSGRQEWSKATPSPKVRAASGKSMSHNNWRGTGPLGRLVRWRSMRLLRRLHEDVDVTRIVSELAGDVVDGELQRAVGGRLNLAAGADQKSSLAGTANERAMRGEGAKAFAKTNNRQN